LILFILPSKKVEYSRKYTQIFLRNLKNIQNNSGFLIFIQQKSWVRSLRLSDIMTCLQF